MKNIITKKYTLILPVSDLYVERVKEFCTVTQSYYFNINFLQMLGEKHTAWGFYSCYDITPT